jgi:transcriptional regulator with PAS, ATPase and Fis domain
MKHDDAPPAAAIVEALLSSLDAAFPDVAVFVVDGEQRVTSFSPGAERLLGQKAQDVIGEHCRKANRCVTCMMGCGLKDRGSVDGVALELFREGGGSVKVRKYARAIVDDDGTFLGGVEILIPDADAVVSAPSARAAFSERGGALAIIDDAVDATVERAGILTRDPAMRRLLALVENVAQTDVTVLLRGESGTGKELFARLLHDSSHRRAGPFVAVNCAAITPSLLESELFGHEKGAFTGAVSTHQGYFERANGGTIFLDEIAELPLEVQAKLLRVLETRRFFRVGGKNAVDVDVRVVSATHRSLRQEVAQGRFREDLMYRLRVVPIHLPPLRERRTDIPLLAQRFVDRLNAHGDQRGGRRMTAIAPDALRTLFEWPFAGNVRELKNAIEYAFAVGAGPTLRKADLPAEMVLAPPDLAPAPTTPSTAPSTVPLQPTTTATTTTTMPSPPPPRRRGRPKVAVDPDEKHRIEAALISAGGDVAAAAKMLGMSRATFWRRRAQASL